MIALLLSIIVACAVAAPHEAEVHSSVAVLAPSPNAAAVVTATEAVKLTQPKSLSYTVTNVNSPTGAIKQQTAVGKDALGGHTIRHSAQATNVDPLSGQTDVKHDEHEFHINPYTGQAAVHTNNAAGSLNPSTGHAAFAQKSHEAKIAPGHASVADVADTATVTSLSSAASRDVNAARTDLVHDGVAQNSHASHKSYVNAPGMGGQSQAFEANRRSFDGHGYGNLHYDNQAAKHAYDAQGHTAASEAGYKLDQAYDTRVNLGASNELEFSRHAAHDPYGNYGAVTQTRQASQGGQLVPVAHEEAVLLSQPGVVAVREVTTPVVYTEQAPVAYKEQHAVIYNEPAVVYGQAYPHQAYAQSGYYHQGY